MQPASGESISPRFYNFCVRQFMQFLFFSNILSSFLSLSTVFFGLPSCPGDANK